MPTKLLSLLVLICACTGTKKQTNITSAFPTWTLTPFVKANDVNPILQPQPQQIFTDPILKKEVRWEEKDVFNPAAIIRNDTLFLLYRAEDVIGKYAGTSRIGLAWSLDGLHFTKYAAPVLYPDNDAQKTLEWEGGCEDPRVVQDASATYFMTYTAYDGDKARLMVASSKDLMHWNKHGHVFRDAFDGRYTKGWSKSGSIVSDYTGGTPVARKINGLYWMYWGDVNIWAATSPDLIHWTPLLYEKGQSADQPLRHNASEIPEVRTILAPRNGKFDADIIEPGPPAIMTPQGILLIYNGRNVRDVGDKNLPEGTYAGAQVLLDREHPERVLQRMDTWFIRPDQPYETNGQVNEVCFLEGLVRYKGKWFLYYGTADSKIAVAVKELSRN